MPKEQLSVISITRLAKLLGTSPPTLVREVGKLQQPVKTLNGLVLNKEIPRLQAAIGEFRQNQNSKQK